MAEPGGEYRVQAEGVSEQNQDEDEDGDEDEESTRPLSWRVWDKPLPYLKRCGLRLAHVRPDSSSSLAHAPIARFP